MASEEEEEAEGEEEEFTADFRTVRCEIKPYKMIFKGAGGWSTF